MHKNTTLLVFALLLLMVSQGKSQQTPYLGLFQENWVLINPAFLDHAQLEKGENNMLINSSYRQQWLGFDEGPQQMNVRFEQVLSTDKRDGWDKPLVKWGLGFTREQVASFTGTGLHSGRSVVLTVNPAQAGQGIVFRRTDVTDRPNTIPARWYSALQTPLNTRIENAEGVAVSTIEHLMAALAGCGLHNALIDVDGSEVPILDGSAADFVRGLLSAGQRQMPAALDAIRILNNLLQRTTQKNLPPQAIAHLTQKTRESARNPECRHLALAAIQVLTVDVVNITAEPTK
jgi:hypothetical protein